MALPTSKHNIEFELAEIPPEMFDKFQIGKGETHLLLHEVLCKAIHEDDEDAKDFLNDFVVNISLAGEEPDENK